MRWIIITASVAFAIYFVASLIAIAWLLTNPPAPEMMPMRAVSMVGWDFEKVVERHGQPDFDERLAPDEVSLGIRSMRGLQRLMEDEDEVRHARWHSEEGVIEAWFVARDDDWLATYAKRWHEGLQF